MTTEDPTTANPDSDAHPPETRPLPVLRAMIDAVDREILQLLARMMRQESRRSQEARCS